MHGLMRPYSDTSYSREDGTGYSEFEEEIKPPVQKRLIQITIAALVLIAIVSVIIAKVMSDQSQTASQEAKKAIAMQNTAEAQVTSLAAQVDSLTATLQAPQQAFQPPRRSFFTSPGEISGTLQRRQFGRDIAEQTRSRMLAYAALTALSTDPEAGILIALAANQAYHTAEAEDALRRALTASQVRLMLSVPDAQIKTAAFSPNGEWIVTTDSSGTTRVWNASNGTLAFPIHQAGQAFSAQFSPDGRYILTLSSNQTAVLWRADTGAPVAVFSGQGADLTVARFSSLGDRLVTGDASGALRIWYTNGISNSIILTSTLGRINQVEWSTDDQRILATSDRGLTVWDGQSAKPLFTVMNPITQNAWMNAQFYPDGTQLVASFSDEVRILNAATGQVIRTVPGVSARNVQFSSSGGQLLTGDILWDVKTWQVIGRLPNEASFIPRFSPNGRYLVSHDDRDALTVWNARSTTWPLPVAAALKDTADALAVYFSPYGQMAISIDRDGAARVWAVQSNTNLPSDYQDLLTLARSRVTRQLTCQERQNYLNDTTPCATATP